MSSLRPLQEYNKNRKEQHKTERTYCYEKGDLHARIDVLAILRKNLNRTILRCILQNFRTCTTVTEALTPLDRTSRIRLYKKNPRSRLFCRIAKRSMGDVATGERSFQSNNYKWRLKSLELRIVVERTIIRQWSSERS